MKTLIALCIIFILGCKSIPGDPVNKAAIHFAGVCMTDNIHSDLSIRIKGVPDVTKESGGIYHVTGMAEGYSSYNVPESVEHFSETLRYSGGNPNNNGSWACVDIYVGKKKMK